MSKILKAKPESVMEASYNAQIIAFAPVIFQAAKSLRDLGILGKIGASGKRGISVEDIAADLKLSVYGIEVLLEVGEKAGLTKLKDSRHVLQPTGRFILSDQMTRINMDFTNDVCYKGLFYLEDSIRKGRPAGLKVFGEWDTIYQAFFSLPQKVQKSWFNFDHFYSDSAFSVALPFVFRDKPKSLLDIGGNTGKWAIACCKHDSDVMVTILDLPGQLEKARQNISSEGLESRIKLCPTNLLNHSKPYPEGFDALWMSQLLVCFPEADIIQLLKKAAHTMSGKSRLFILDTFCDRQRNEVGEFCLQATSLYFTCMANGNSRMYHSDVIKKCIHEAGLVITQEHHNLGGDHTLFCCHLM